MSSEISLKNYQNLLMDKAYYKTAFDTLADLVWYKDLDGIFVKINEKVIRLIGLKHSEIIGKNDYDLFEKDRADYFREIDIKAMYSDEPLVVREYLSASDGSFQGWFETTKAPMKDADGNVIGVLGIARDIDEIVNQELELKKIYEHDSLTGLMNRHTFMKSLSEFLENSDENRSHSILFIDLDRFR